MKLFTLMAVLLFVSPSAYAGHEVGNAAHAVVCRDAQQAITRPPESLDLFEAKAIHGMTLVPVSQPGYLSRDVQAYLARLSPLTPLRGLAWAQFAKTFEAERKFTDQPLQVVKDYADAALPKDCAIEQVVSQSNFRDALKQGWRYRVNEELWYALPHVDRVAVVVHEVIYRELIDHKEKHQHNREIDSKKVRLLVANIVADLIKTLPSKGVVEYLEQMLPHVEKRGALLDLTYSRPGLRQAPDEEPSTCHIPLQESFVYFDDQALQLAPNVFTVCVYERTYGAWLTDFAVKAGSLVELRFRKFRLPVKAKNFLDIPHEGMKVDSFSQSQMGRIRHAGPFEDVSFNFASTDSTQSIELLVNTITIDSDIAKDGVAVTISADSKQRYKSKDVDLQLLASNLYPQEFNLMSQSAFGSLRNLYLHQPRKLHVAGSVMFKKKLRKIDRGFVSFDASGNVTSVCDTTATGDVKCL